MFRKIWQAILAISRWEMHVLDFLTPVGDLIARIYIAQIFLRSGWLKVTSWQSTVQLFTYEFHVPLLSPYWAALLGTTAELVLPILLILGLGGRTIILIFFIYNIITVISYPFLLTPSGAAGLQEHIVWGILLMLLMFHGAGKLSLDYLVETRLQHIHKYRQKF